MKFMRVLNVSIKLESMAKPKLSNMYKGYKGRSLGMKNTPSRSHCPEVLQQIVLWKQQRSLRSWIAPFKPL